VGSRPRPGPSEETSGDEDQDAGTAIVEDDVEIGAGVTIDCAREGATIIGRGTKIDNLVQIGADSTVGCNCIIVSQAVIGSNCSMGDEVTMAGQAGMIDGRSIGRGTIVAAKSGILEDVGENQVVSGIPAYSHEKWLRVVASMKRLPTIVRDIREFKKQLTTMGDSKYEKTENH
jgi:UDP-3-O-[3-hydroxymyristoyl] glucosamine N-acyltransferase